MDIFNKETYLGENDKGYEFYLSKNLTKYAEEKGLEDIIVAYTKKKGEEDFETILLCENRLPIYSSKSIEGIGAHIDILALAKEL